MAIRHILICVVVILGMFRGQAQTYSEQYESTLERSKILWKSMMYILSWLKCGDSALIGTSVPNFTAVTIEGEVVEMETLKGRVVPVGIRDVSYEEFGGVIRALLQ